MLPRLVDSATLDFVTEPTSPPVKHVYSLPPEPDPGVVVRAVDHDRRALLYRRAPLAPVGERQWQELAVTGYQTSFSRDLLHWAEVLWRCNGSVIAVPLGELLRDRRGEAAYAAYPQPTGAATWTGLDPMIREAWCEVAEAISRVVDPVEPGRPTVEALAEALAEAIQAAAIRRDAMDDPWGSGLSWRRDVFAGLCEVLDRFGLRVTSS